MANIFYHSSNYLIKTIESVLDANIHLHGQENLLHDSPTIFVANHFTRFETFVMPYIIFSHADMQVRSLGDYSIFVGYFGKFLAKVGTLSTTHEKRDEIILGDIITGRKNWVIYPEGNMVKNKKVTKNGEFKMHLDSKTQSIHTGAAVLAMRAETLKTEFKQAQQDGDLVKVARMRDEFFIGADERVSYRNTVIIPVNITYTPIRSGTNPLMSIGDKFVEKMDERIKEELEIEGNILLNSQIHIRFDKPIDIKEYLYHAKKEYKDKSSEELIELNRHDLTTQFMDAVYKNVLINFDHIFALALEFHNGDFIGINEFKRAIFLAARDVVGLKTYSVHHSITDELYKFLVDEDDERFNSALSLALSQKILVHVEEDLYKIDRLRFEDEHNFHTIRIKNTFRVILNEISLFKDLSKSVKNNLQKSTQEIKQEVFHVIFNRDKKIYKNDYNHFYSVIFSKDREIGAPFILYNKNFTTGVVLSHGYKSSPSEIKELAAYLFKKEINVYGVRLSGHGTVSEDLRDSTWQQWYDSFNRAYAAMRQVNKKLFLVGFSTGGLLALLATKRKLNKIDGLIVINAALELQDIRVDYIVPTLNKLNDFLSIFKADLDYVESEPEYPEFNYKRNYIKSLNQLHLLMQECQDALGSITAPSLIIQGKNDPVVKAHSGQKIFQEISSKDKKLKEYDFSRHVIVLGEGTKKVFNEVYLFIDRHLSKKKIS